MAQLISFAAGIGFASTLTVLYGGALGLGSLLIASNLNGGRSWHGGHGGHHHGGSHGNHGTSYGHHHHHHKGGNDVHYDGGHHHKGHHPHKGHHKHKGKHKGKHSSYDYVDEYDDHDHDYHVDSYGSDEVYDDFEYGRRKFNKAKQKRRLRRKKKRKNRRYPKSITNRNDMIPVNHADFVRLNSNLVIVSPVAHVRHRRRISVPERRRTSFGPISLTREETLLVSAFEHDVAKCGQKLICEISAARRSRPLSQLEIQLLTFMSEGDKLLDAVHSKRKGKMITREIFRSYREASTRGVLGESCTHRYDKCAIDANQMIFRIRTMMKILA